VEEGEGAWRLVGTLVAAEAVPRQAAAACLCLHAAAEPLSSVPRLHQTGTHRGVRGNCARQCCLCVPSPSGGERAADRDGSGGRRLSLRWRRREYALWSLNVVVGGRLLRQNGP
jgi:hypothetical protein